MTPALDVPQLVYGATFPILDDQASTADLIEEATDQVADMVAKLGMMIVRLVTWDVVEVDGDGALEFLVAFQVRSASSSSQVGRRRRALRVVK